jgi:hypothetical protein
MPPLHGEYFSIRCMKKFLWFFGFNKIASEAVSEAIFRFFGFSLVSLDLTNPKKVFLWIYSESNLYFDASFFRGFSETYFSTMATFSNFFNFSSMCPLDDFFM